MFKGEPNQEIIPVRPDEQFDETALAKFLLGKLPGSENPLTVRQFGGGAANLTCGVVGPHSPSSSPGLRMPYFSRRR